MYKNENNNMLTTGPLETAQIGAPYGRSLQESSNGSAGRQRIERTRNFRKKEAHFFPRRNLKHLTYAKRKTVETLPEKRHVEMTMIDSIRVSAGIGCFENPRLALTNQHIGRSTA